MEIRPLGGTGLAVSRIGLGLAALGRPVYIDVGRERDLGSERTRAAMEARCREVLDAGYAAGIRYVDAARSYGDAEAFLGAWLEAGDRAAHHFRCADVPPVIGDDVGAPGRQMAGLQIGLDLVTSQETGDAEERCGAAIFSHDACD